MKVVDDLDEETPRKCTVAGASKTVILHWIASPENFEPKLGTEANALTFERAG